MSSHLFPNWLGDELAESLSTKMGIKFLYPMQEKCSAHLIQAATSDLSTDVCIASPTGSGKTLCYAIPAVRYLMRHLSTSNVMCLVLLPSKDTAQEVHSVFETLCANTSLHVALVNGTHSLAQEQQMLRKNVPMPDGAGEPVRLCLGHIVVATPRRVLDHVDAIPDLLHAVRFLIIDEADALLSPSNVDWIFKLFDAMKEKGGTESRQRTVHKILCSATLTSSLPLFVHFGLHNTRTFTKDDTRKVLKEAPATPVVATTEGTDEVSEKINAINGKDDADDAVEEEPAEAKPAVKKPAKVDDDDDDLSSVDEEEVNTMMKAMLGDNYDVIDAEGNDVAPSYVVKQSFHEPEIVVQPVEPEEEPEPEFTIEEVTRALPPDSFVLPDTLEEVLIELPESEKLNSLVGLLEQLGARKQDSQDVILVFCNSVVRTHRLHRFLGVAGYRSVEFSRNLSNRNRLTNMNTILLRGDANIVVATDVLGRGMDFAQRVSAVIHYDAPEDSRAYVHRCGRTARANRHGTAYVFCQPDLHEFITTMRGQLQPPKQLKPVPHPPSVPRSVAENITSALQSVSKVLTLEGAKQLSISAPIPHARRLDIWGDAQHEPVDRDAKRHKGNDGTARAVGDGDPTPWICNMCKYTNTCGLRESCHRCRSDRQWDEKKYTGPMSKAKHGGNWKCGKCGCRNGPRELTCGRCQKKRTAGDQLMFSIAAVKDKSEAEDIQQRLTKISEQIQSYEEKKAAEAREARANAPPPASPKQPVAASVDENGEPVVVKKRGRTRRRQDKRERSAEKTEADVQE